MGADALVVWHSVYRGRRWRERGSGASERASKREKERQGKMKRKRKREKRVLATRLVQVALATRALCFSPTEKKRFNLSNISRSYHLNIYPIHKNPVAESFERISHLTNKKIHRFPHQQRKKRRSSSIDEIERILGVSQLPGMSNREIL